MPKVEDHTEDDDLLEDNIDDINEDDDQIDNDDDTSDDDIDEEGNEDDDEGNDEDDEDDKKSKKSKSDKARATLNAQNRFLIKEGYEFVKGKGWVKKSKPNNQKQPSSKKAELTTQDVIVLVKANVPEEDISEVQDYAKMKGISIKEALNAPFVKTLLANNAEERETANATHIGSSKKQNNRRDPTNVISDARKGQLPDDPAELAKARAAQRQGKNAHKRR